MALPLLRARRQGSPSCRPLPRRDLAPPPACRSSSILPRVSGSKTPTGFSVAGSAAWTERARARKSVPYTLGSRYSHVDALAFVEGWRRAGGSVARGVLADTLPGGRGAHRGPDAPRQPGAEHVLQHLGRHRLLSPRPPRAVHLALSLLS